MQNVELLAKPVLTEISCTEAGSDPGVEAAVEVKGLPQGDEGRALVFTNQVVLPLDRSHDNATQSDALSHTTT